MKTVIKFLLLFISCTAFSQVPPELISYRAVALNASGTLIPNQNIGIRISILDNTSSAIYVESHVKMTDNGAAYNLQIGGGTPISGTFSNINWGQGDTFLKVEIDPTGPANGTNYSVYVGTTQFLSVPYALYSKNTINGIEPTANMNTLIADVVPEPNKLVYLKCYAIPEDGGEGVFIFDATNTLTPNYGTIIQSTNPTWSNTHPEGRWIRQYSGYLNAGYFGVGRGGYVNMVPNSDRIQNMIDYASAHTMANDKSAMTIFFPNGEYYIDKTLILKSRVKLLGEAGTKFNYFPGSTYDYMIELDKAPVVFCGMENFLLELSDAKDVGGIHFKAEGTKTDTTGGVWMSTFKNIQIVRLKGNGIFLEGGEDTFNLPNQFLNFENVRVVRSGDRQYNSLKMTGEQGQITFLNCTFDGYSAGKNNFEGVNIYIGKVNNENPTGSGNAVISFINCTSQDSEYGVVIDRSENITFDNCWFESLHVGSPGTELEFAL